MNIEKIVDFVLDSLAIFAILAILYGMLQLLPAAFDQMFAQWGMK